MVCIYCGDTTHVTNSRLQKRSNSIWRRRVCGACSAIFTTLEHADLSSSIRVQRPEGLEPFVRDKLLISVYEACKHRPKALDDTTSLTHTIIGDMLRYISPEGVIKRNQIVELAHGVLARFDSVAATIYVAYHK